MYLQYCVQSWTKQLLGVPYGNGYSTLQLWNARALYLRKEAVLKVFIR